MQLPQQLLDSLQDVPGFDKITFENVHSSGEQITSIRINPFKLKDTSHIPPLGDGRAVSWSQYGYYLSERPSFTFDPLFHAGCYYVQEASSMFLEQALKQTIDLSNDIKVLDLCAAPGGKSTHIQSLISKNSLLVSNEVIKSRAAVLKDNIIKWGCSNVMVTNNDPKDFSKLKGYFDVIVIDAPCSGSGLFRREPEAMEEWSVNNVQLCCQRQQRILADVWPALKENGILIYSTCSYSTEEDEQIINWLLSEFQIIHLKLEIPAATGIIESNGGYRFWPDKLRGEGFFIACFQKIEDTETVIPKLKQKPEAVTKKEVEIIGDWIKGDEFHFIKNKNIVYAWHKAIADDFAFLLQHLFVAYSGIIVGELMRDKLVPEHALAMSPFVQDHIKKIDLSKEQAINYLKRKDIEVTTANKGWQLAAYQGYPLGWINVLTNRINNYYPKELRILKDN